MQKVYLLLRSNKQTGPYTLEELLQFNLKPFDLVWVEGRSAAWQYPFEIPALKPYIPDTPQAEIPFQPIATSALEEKTPKEQAMVPQKPEVPKKVFVTLPKTYKPANEQQAYNTQSFPEHKAYMPKEEKVEREEIKPTAFASSQPTATYINQKPVEEEIHTNYSRPIDDVEQDYTNWVYKQKTKKKPKVNSKELVLAGLILVVIAGGYYIMSKPSVANSVLPTNKMPTQTVAQPIENKADETPAQQDAVSEQQNIVHSAPETKPTENITRKNPASVSTNQTTSSVPPVKNSMPDAKTSNIPGEEEVIVSREPEEKKQTTTENPEKKKKLREVLKGIFTKKEKEEAPKKDVAVEDPKPAENRQATRRGNDNTTTEPNKEEEMNETSLATQVDLSSNAPDNWMMGIKNLKITLRNRSNATIQTAAVMVSYFDGNNQLLEKKLVYFNNVAPKSRATVAAPDHKWADHVDFKLTTVSAKDDRFASN